ncbi:hypothetical protein ABZU86_10860 [Streptomyces sp. NPDC005271]|uniref:hypothetical protein n=1 Tax=unclassified Streptomyces TaxID=2593676 RepID=UPI0033B22673
MDAEHLGAVPAVLGEMGHVEGTATLERSGQRRSPEPLAWGFVVERVTGIEPAL